MAFTDHPMMQHSLYIFSFNVGMKGLNMEKNWKQAAKRVVAAVLFVSLLVGSIYGVNWLFRLKATDGCYPVQMFYKQKKDSIDVLCLGSSHTYTNINPAVLWDDYGIAAYDLAGSNQPFWNSYYYLKEALKYQTPELVVLDVYRAIETQDYQDDARTAMNTFGLRYSKDYKENIKVSLFPTETELDYLLKFPIYHARYQEMKEADFKFYNNDANRRNYKGFNLNCISTTVFGEFPDISGVTEVEQMTDKTKEYLEKIILLTEEQDIPLLLVVAPYIDGITEDKKIFNQVELLAKQCEIDFVDFNEYYGRIGLDPTTDFAEGSHLNYYGNEKYSRYLGQYIVDNYDVSDRRGDAAYDSWEQNARFYEKHAADVDLMKTDDRQEYFKKLFASADRYTICVNVTGNCSDSQEIENLLKTYDMDLQNGSVWVFQGGDLVYSLPTEQEIKQGDFFETDLGKNSLCIETKIETNAFYGDYPVKTVTLEGTRSEKAARGINIIVYDNELQNMVDNIGLDADDSYQIHRN